MGRDYHYTPKDTVWTYVECSDLLFSTVNLLTNNEPVQ